MNQEAFYDRLPHLYDLLHADVKEDLPYWKAAARTAEPPTLELGCGTGRVLLPLARAGVRVTGIDSSTAMLARARAALAREPHETASRAKLIQGDMSQYALSERFGLIFAAQNTFSHLDPGARGRCLRAAHRHLLPGGRLMLDLPNPFPLVAAEGEPRFVDQGELIDPVSGAVIRQHARSEFDMEGRRLNVTWRLTIDEGGPAPRRETFMIRYYLAYPHEWELFLAAAGLRLTALEGDYGGTPFGEESDRLLLSAIVDG